MLTRYRRFFQSFVLFIAAFLAVSASVLIFNLAETNFSEFFNHCISHPSAEQAAQYARRNGDTVAVVILNTYCTVHFIDAHNGLFAAIGGAFVALFTGVLWRSTHHLMKASNEQGALTRQSISQAARAADAMGHVAKSLAINAEQIVIAVSTNKLIAERQKTFGEMQMRAYITILVGSIFVQEKEKNAFFQCHVGILNTGNTPAHNLTCRARVDVRPFPDVEPFDFTLPPPGADDSSVTLGAHQQASRCIMLQRWMSDEEAAEVRATLTKRAYCFGTIEYDDAFGVHHFSNWCYHVGWSITGAPSGYWTSHHNDSD